MTLCALPPPISLLTEPYYNTDSEQKRQSSQTSSRPPTVASDSFRAANMSDSQRLGSISPARSAEQTHLPSFTEFIRTLPEEVGQSLKQPPPTAMYSHGQLASSLTAPRPSHSRSSSGRSQWHPYSPPRTHSSNPASTPSRTPSPSITDESSGTEGGGQQTRVARPTYTEEEIYFIWYHRDDLGMGWNQVLDMFNNRFGRRERNGVQGIQCRYYRALEIHHVPKSRARDRSLPNEAYGVRQRAPEKWWPWMQR